MGDNRAIEREPGARRRLELLAQIHAEHTAALLDRVGIPEGSSCLDLGCGTGHVSRALARRSGKDGSVHAFDRDEGALELARGEPTGPGAAPIEFRVGGASTLQSGRYDILYARFALSGLKDPARAIAALAAAARPGAHVVIEETDFSASFCHPPSRAFRRFIELHGEATRQRGGNADLGPSIPTLLKRAGLEEIEVEIRQPCGLAGPVKALAPLTLEQISETAIRERLATPEELASLRTDLGQYCADPSTLIATPAVVQAHARAHRVPVRARLSAGLRAARGNGRQHGSHHGRRPH